MLGLDLVVTAERYGAVTVIYTPGDGHGSSGSVDPDDLATYCTHTITTGGGPELIAHELGHASGLSHRDDATNLMHPVVGTELDDEQIDLLRWHAWWRQEECTP